MSRLLEFHQADEAVIVSRILLHVHKAVDQNFPHVKQTSRRFAKTLFSENDEPTHNKPLPVANPDSLPVMPVVPPPPASLDRDRQTFREEAQPLSPPPRPLDAPPPRKPAPPPAHPVPPPHPGAARGKSAGSRDPIVVPPVSSADAVTDDPMPTSSPKRPTSPTKGQVSVATHLSDAQGLERYQKRRQNRLRILSVLLFLSLLYLFYEQRAVFLGLFTSLTGKGGAHP